MLNFSNFDDGLVPTPKLSSFFNLGFFDNKKSYCFFKSS